MKQHLISLRIYITMHWPKVDLNIRLPFKNSKNISTVTITPKIEKRKIIWFNPLISLNVSTNIGKQCFSLLGKHVPKTHQLHELFNRNNVKVSYSSSSGKCSDPVHFLNSQGKFFLSFLSTLFHIFLTPKIINRV